jgi:hypothetical protein
MTEPPPDGIPPDVAELLDLERRAAPAPDSARQRIAGRLGLVVPPPAPPAGQAARPWWAAPAVPAGVVLLAGAAVVAWLSSPRALPPPARPQPPAVVAPVELPAPPVPPTLPPPVPTQAPASKPQRIAMPAESEIVLLRRAREALSRKHARQAVTLVERHRRQWPDGALVQEREVLAIQALTLAGAEAEARARADRFLRDFPGSTLAAAVHQLRRELQDPR